MEATLLTLGVLLILVGLLGQVKAQEIEVGTKNPIARTILGLVGVVFVVISLRPLLAGLGLPLPPMALPTPADTVQAPTPATNTTPVQPPSLEEWSLSPAEVTAGGTVNLRWRVVGADSVKLQPFGNVEDSGELEDIPRNTKRYTLIASNPGGVVEESLEVVVTTPVPGAPAASLQVAPNKTVRGVAAEVLLSWQTSGADTVTIEPGLGPVGLQGERNLPVPSQNTVYTLVARGPGGETTASTQLTVEEARCRVVSQKLNLRSGPGTDYEPLQQMPQGTNLEPLGYYAGGSPEPGWIEVSVQGSNTHGWVRARDEYATCNMDRTLLPAPGSIPPLPAPAISSFRFNPGTIEAGNCTQLEWGAVSHATQVSIDHGIGQVDAPGSQKVCPDETTTYTLTAAGPGGSVTGSATCTVNVPAVAECYGVRSDLPDPVLKLTGTETDSSAGFTRYRLSVTNRSEFPDKLFEAAPDLPACGKNTNASRTWVDILDGATHKKIYGFCAFSASDNLDLLWFAVKQGDKPPDSVLVELTDRRCNTTYTSNAVAIQRP
jgi:hypothetical protein